MARYPLVESARAIADASGRASVRMGPRRAFEKWHINSATVQSTSSTDVPEVRVYRGAEAEGLLVGGSHTGTLDATISADVLLQTFEDLLFVWTDSDVGAACVAVINGERVLP